jgi:hypothetical protein
VLQVAPSKVRAGGLRFYWFVAHPVKAGDVVVLYTGPGTDEHTTGTDGKSVHFYHWGEKQTIFGAPNSCALLFELAAWETSPK